MTEQLFHISKAYIKKAKMKHFAMFGTLMFWCIFAGSLVRFVRGEITLFGDEPFVYFILLAGLLIGTVYGTNPNRSAMIKLDAESLLLVNKEKEVFTLFSEIDRLVIEHFSNQKIKRILCFYDKKSCCIEGFENMDDIALVLSQNVSEVRKKKVLMIFDSPLFLFVLISMIIMVVQMALLVIDGWVLKA